MSQGSGYNQLHRNIVIRDDCYGGAKSQPRILAAGLGFESITGTPSQLSEAQMAWPNRRGPGWCSSSWG